MSESPKLRKRQVLRMINNLISQGFNYVKDNIPGAEDMYHKAMGQIQGHATPASLFNALMGMAQQSGDHERIKQHKFYPMLENLCKQSTDNVVPYAQNAAKELGIMGVLTNFLNKNQ